MENKQTKRDRIAVGNEKESINRPAWTSTDLHACRHKHVMGGVIENHYVRSRGL